MEFRKRNEIWSKGNGTGYRDEWIPNEYSIMMMPNVVKNSNLAIQTVEVV